MLCAADGVLPSSGLNNSFDALGVSTMIEFVNVGPDGTFETSGDHSTAPVEIDKLFDQLETTSATAIAIHFHGGLVSEVDGVMIARKMASVYRAAGSHPLTFVWETGLFETFRDNLTHIHGTKLFQKLLKWIVRRVAQRFGGLDGRGAGAPLPLAAIEAELAKPKPFESYDGPVTGLGTSRGRAPVVEEHDLDGLQEDLEAELQEDVEGDEEIGVLLQEWKEHEVDARAKGIVSGIKIAKLLAVVAFRVIRRHVRNRDHGFYPTIVEELLREIYLADLGAWVWSRMKAKAANMWLPNDGRTGEELRAGAYVLDSLAKFQAKHPGFQVDLIGHSAGSIAICEMLRAAAARGTPLKIRWIVFLAPAGRSELGLAEIAHHPERYEHFRAYTMADEYERNDAMLPRIYTRSLLYFISGVLEPDEVDAPIMGMMRHASGNGAFSSGTAREWADFMTGSSRLVLSDSALLNRDAPAGFRSTSRKHGAFDDDDATLESLTTILKA